jgi:hypothetical protein
LLVGLVAALPPVLWSLLLLLLWPQALLLPGAPQGLQLKLGLLGGGPCWRALHVLLALQAQAAVQQLAGEAAGCFLPALQRLQS